MLSFCYSHRPSATFGFGDRFDHCGLFATANRSLCLDLMLDRKTSLSTVTRKVCALHTPSIRENSLGWDRLHHTLFNMLAAGHHVFVEERGASTQAAGASCSLRCLHDMRGIDGCVLSCGHALHSDCISGWANAAVIPSCPLCRIPCH